MSEPPSYAPTATSSFTVEATNYHEEVTRASLSQAPTDRDVLSSLAEIYSIITVLEMVENSFIKDYLTDKEKYTSTTLRLISQYQIIIKGFKDDPNKYDSCVKFVPNITRQFDNFLLEFPAHFKLRCPLAIKRLETGIPVTIEHASSTSSANAVPRDDRTGTPSQNARLVAEATGNFITCMDALKLNFKTKDQLHPLLSELIINLNELLEENTRFEFQGKSKLINWLIKLNNLDSSQALQPEEIEEFLGDLTAAYKNFYATLE